MANSNVRRNGRMNSSIATHQGIPQDEPDEYPQFLHVVNVIGRVIESVERHEPIHSVK